MMNLSQFPTSHPAWVRVVEQKISDLEARVFRLETQMNQLRQQIGNLPVSPAVVVP